MDVKDILGVSRPENASGQGGAPAAKKQKVIAPKLKRPEGMSREAFKLLAGTAPTVTSQLIESFKKDEAAKKTKPKASTKGTVTWQYRPFKNSARSDGLEMVRWSKSFKDVHGRLREAEDPQDYYWARFNKKVPVFRYTHDEYESLIKPESDDWTREETDYLLELCERFDLRFGIVADRYSFVPGAPGTPSPPRRSLEDIKDRYYLIARKLLASREGGEAAVANHTIIRHPYCKEYEVQRKIAIEQMLKSTPQQNEEENLILAEYKLIEDKRKSEAAAAAAANKKAQAAAAQAAAAAAAASAPPAAPGPSPFAGNPSEVQLLHPSEFPNRPGPGIPSLFDGSLNPSKMPNPGATFRSVSTSQVSSALNSSLAAGHPRFLKGFEQTLGELGYTLLSAPKVNTRAVCGSWLALRSEVASLQEMRGRGGGQQRQQFAPGSEGKKSVKRKP